MNQTNWTESSTHEQDLMTASHKHFLALRNCEDLLENNRAWLYKDHLSLSRNGI